MDEGKNKPKTRVHKPGVSRNFTGDSYQEDPRRCIFLRRESTPELGVNNLNGLSFHREKRPLDSDNSEVPSYNLWKSRLERRSSLPNSLTFQQKKIGTSSGIFVPSVFTREAKGFRNHSTSIRGTKKAIHSTKADEKAVVDFLGHDINNVVHVLPLEDPWKPTLSRDESGMSCSSRSHCDSVSTIRCTSTDIPASTRNDKIQAYYAKQDSIQRWLSEVE